MEKTYNISELFIGRVCGYNKINRKGAPPKYTINQKASFFVVVRQENTNELIDAITERKYPDWENTADTFLQCYEIKWAVFDKIPLEAIFTFDKKTITTNEIVSIVNQLNNRDTKEIITDEFLISVLEFKNKLFLSVLDNEQKQEFWNYAMSYAEEYTKKLMDFDINCSLSLELYKGTLQVEYSKKLNDLKKTFNIRKDNTVDKINLSIQLKELKNR